MLGLVPDVGVVTSAGPLPQLHFAEEFLVQSSLQADGLGVALDLVAQICDPVDLCQVEDGPAASSLLRVVLDGAELVVVLHYDEPHGVGDRVTESGLLAGGVVLVWPVVYLW